MNLKYPDYNNSILNVSNSILRHYGVNIKYSTIPELDIELANNYNHIIYILLDGMGVNVIKKHLNKKDALRKYLKREITSVFPSTTVAATDSVLSGLPPISSGYIGWVQYFQDEDTDLVIFLNNDYYTNEQYPENLKEKYLSFKTIHQQIKESSPHVETNEFFPSFRENGSNSFKEEIEKVLISTHNNDASFNYVYWTEPDLSEHLYGPNSSEVKQVMTNLNHDFEELIEEIPEDTLVICIADHGLTEIKEIPLYEYNDIMDLLVRNPSIEPRATSFFVKDGQHEIFKENFNKHFNEKFKLYTKQEILDSKLFGIGVPHPKVNEFIGDFFSISISEYMFIFNESKGYIGHHAGLSEDEMIVPLIMYSKKSAK
jgi:predicted AlkP superfamily pyrophosphatase or phosphodiesterase